MNLPTVKPKPKIPKSKVLPSPPPIPKKNIKKAGRPKGTKNIETPGKMWELFVEYRTALKNNTKKKLVTGNKGYIIAEEQLERPLTLEGFENYCADSGIINDLGDYFSNKNDNYSNYSTICLRIRRVIRQDQIEGGMIGIYTPSITQRLNGLVEKSAITVNKVGKDAADEIYE